ncbi:MAG: glycosyltransferase [Chloroflexi bacterium]|nr:glycosyltransferase [Chloroflexota bacterium]
MYGSIPTVPRCLDTYLASAGEEEIAEIRTLAEPLKGLRVLHLSAVAFGGGVAEVLGGLVPLMKDVGLAADWQMIRGTGEFFKATDAMRNALQGALVTWSNDLADVYLRYNRLNAELFDEQYDFVVIHDVQPAALPAMVVDVDPARRRGKWIWQCHIDLTEPHFEVWNFLRPFVDMYDAAIFSVDRYAKLDLRTPKVAVFPPGIDPISTKNMSLSQEAITETLHRHGVVADHPLITQVCSFDFWRDPAGLIEAYKIAKQDVEDLQLALIASMTSEMLQGWTYYKQAAQLAGEDPNVRLLSSLAGVGNLEINALQRASEVIAQKSRREGFGLGVSEGQWKGRPVVGDEVGGIAAQIVDGETGFLVHSPQETADKVLFLLKNKDRADAMGQAGRERVRNCFLITRYLKNCLKLFSELL